MLGLIAALTIGVAGGVAIGVGQAPADDNPKVLAALDDVAHMRTTESQRLAERDSTLDERVDALDLLEESIDDRESKLDEREGELDTHAVAPRADGLGLGPRVRAGPDGPINTIAPSAARIDDLSRSRFHACVRRAGFRRCGCIQVAPSAPFDRLIRYTPYMCDRYT